MSRVTLTAVATHLGVSAMTVSRALRGRPGVSELLRERVQAAAKRLGYRPDPEIGRLMHLLRRGGTKGARASLCGVTDYPENAEPRYCRRLREHAAARAGELGFAFSVLRVAPGKGGWAAALRVLRARGVDGVLLLPLAGATELGDANWEAFAVVSATSSLTKPAFHEVAPNHAANARLLIDRLAAKGFRRLGYVDTAEHSRRTREALPAALAWHQARNGEPCAPLLHPADSAPEIASWARRERPDVIIMGRPTDLPRFRAELKNLRPRPAWALANSRAFFPSGPGLDERDDLIGAVAVDTLASLVTRGERGVPRVPTAVSIAGRWVDRAGRTTLG